MGWFQTFLGGSILFLPKTCKQGFFTRHVLSCEFYQLSRRQGFAKQKGQVIDRGGGGDSFAQGDRVFTALEIFLAFKKASHVSSS